MSNPFDVEDHSTTRRGQYGGGGGSYGDQQRQIQEIQSESAASLQRSMALVAQSTDCATDTLTELDAQGNKIEGMQRSMEQIEANNKQADVHLRGISSWWGALRNKFSRAPARQESQVAPRETLRTPNDPKGASQWVVMDDGDKHAPLATAEDEALDQLGSMVSNLHSMSLAMNHEVKDQNRRLDELSDSVSRNEQHLNRNNQKIRGLLK